MKYRLLVFLTCALAIAAQAQPSLKDFITEDSLDWMFGSWKATTETGAEVTLNVSWDLDKKVVVLHVKAREVEAKGFTVLEPNSEAPSYYSFDNKGFVGKGSWSKENNDLVLRTTTEMRDREPMKAAFVFSGTPETGLQVRQYAIDPDGNLASQPRVAFKFKKQN